MQETYQNTEGHFLIFFNLFCKMEWNHSVCQDGVRDNVTACHWRHSSISTSSMYDHRHPKSTGIQSVSCSRSKHRGHPHSIQLSADQRPCSHGSREEKPYGRRRFRDGSSSWGRRGGDDQQWGGCQKSVGWMFRDGSHQVGWKQTFRQNCEVYRLGRAAFPR